MQGGIGDRTQVHVRVLSFATAMLMLSATSIASRDAVTTRSSPVALAFSSPFGSPLISSSSTTRARAGVNRVPQGTHSWSPASSSFGGRSVESGYEITVAAASGRSAAAVVAAAEAASRIKAAATSATASSASSTRQAGGKKNDSWQRGVWGNKEGKNGSDAVSITGSGFVSRPTNDRSSSSSEQRSSRPTPQVFPSSGNKDKGDSNNSWRLGAWGSDRDPNGSRRGSGGGGGFVGRPSDTPSPMLIKEEESSRSASKVFPSSGGSKDKDRDSNNSWKLGGWGSDKSNSGSGGGKGFTAKSLVSSSKGRPSKSKRGTRKSSGGSYERGVWRSDK